MTQYPISALDGRYAKHVAPFASIMSEYGLMGYRFHTMSQWLLQLETEGFVAVSSRISCDFTKSFDENGYMRIKELEATTNHDVKAVEYYMREKLPEELWPWIHFGCTSEDVNNVAYALMLTEANKVLKGTEDSVLIILKEMAKNWEGVAMLGRTHGQPATPTTMGKEMAVFAHRLSRILDRKRSIRLLAKWNGATGNHAAHVIAFPERDWVQISKTFIKNRLRLSWNPLTTQIESHDTQAELLGEMGRVCAVLIDLCNDVWGYVSNEYLGLKVKKTETGSSTMPGKVNPIDFENARGQFKTARALGQLLAEELPVSMWQRDLTDSTLQRNLGSVFGHYLVGLASLKRGLEKLEIRQDVLQGDLAHHPEVLGEAIQTVLRKHGHTNGYEQTKELLRGNKVSLEEIREFIRTLSIPESDMERLLALTPAEYVGESARLVGYIGK